MSKQQTGRQVSTSRRVPFGAWMAVATVVVVLDQLSKWFIVKWVPLYDRVPVTSFLNITHHQNRGAAFSFLADQSGWQRWFFAVLAAAVSAYIVAWMWRMKDDDQNILSSGLALVLGGAVGNLFDRVQYGYVIDFIQVLFGSWAFPTFNVADAAISVGAGLLIIDTLFFSRKSEDAATGR